jgi:flagellar operon protein
MAIDTQMKIIPSGGLTEVRGPQTKPTVSGPSFSDTLSQQAEKAAKKTIAAESAQAKEATKPILKFSNHALERMNTRGIHFSPDQITKIEQGMMKASQKGAKETLVLTDDSALIVSLKNSTVVTVMDKSMLRENVFTNIDSTVFV